MGGRRSVALNNVEGTFIRCGVEFFNLFRIRGAVTDIPRLLEQRHPVLDTDETGGLVLASATCGTSIPVYKPVCFCLLLRKDGDDQDYGNGHQKNNYRSLSHRRLLW